MVDLKPLYSRLERLAQRQSSLFYGEAQQEHVKILFFKLSYILIKKRSGLKYIGFGLNIFIHISIYSNIQIYIYNIVMMGFRKKSWDLYESVSLWT